MEYNKLVSVVMPVHNGERFLREAIESVLNQTYTNFEFLIIENCSTDSSVEIIKSYKDDRIRLIIEKECGQVQAYNRGFREAKGEYIFIHDQDDISHPKRFEKQLQYMIDKKIDICGSDIKLIDKNGKIISESKKQVNNGSIKKELLYKPTTIHNSSACIRKDVLEKLNYWRVESFPVADCEFFIRAIDDYDFANIPEFLYFYRRHSSQITSIKKKLSIEKFLCISIKKIEERKMIIPIKEYYYLEGLTYYYSNYMLKALHNLIKSAIYFNYSKELLRYLFIIIVFGIPLKIIRKTNILDYCSFSSAKKYINKIFKIENEVIV